MTCLFWPKAFSLLCCDTHYTDENDTVKRGPSKVRIMPKPEVYIHLHIKAKKATCG
jgi:hypothetical protein